MNKLKSKLLPHSSWKYYSQQKKHESGLKNTVKLSNMSQPIYLYLIITDFRYCQWIIMSLKKKKKLNSDKPPSLLRLSISSSVALTPNLGRKLKIISGIFLSIVLYEYRHCITSASKSSASSSG